MRIKITADSTCDLSREILDRYGVTVIPLYVIKNGQVLKDGVDIFPSDIFSHVEAGGELCTTAPIRIEDYRAYFAEFSQQYEAVLHINIGSGFSFCYQNACAAAAEFRNVRAFDSHNLSTGQGHIVIEAAKMAASGLDLETICAKLENLMERIETSFILEQLDYMDGGGKSSLVTAIGANILHLRSCIEIVGGKMQVAKKYRGTIENRIESYIRDRLEDRTDIETRRIFITHSCTDDLLVKKARATIRKFMNFEEIAETKAGCVISCHCGPNTLGVLFIKKTATFN